MKTETHRDNIGWDQSNAAAGKDLQRLPASHRKLEEARKYALTDFREKDLPKTCFLTSDLQICKDNIFVLF